MLKRAPFKYNHIFGHAGFVCVLCASADIIAMINCYGSHKDYIEIN